jgi:hypothetical protein
MLSYKTNNQQVSILSLQSRHQIKVAIRHLVTVKTTIADKEKDELSRNPLW